LLIEVGTKVSMKPNHK